jgi:hypothetical protein
MRGIARIATLIVAAIVLMAQSCADYNDAPPPGTYSPPQVVGPTWGQITFFEQDYRTCPPNSVPVQPATHVPVYSANYGSKGYCGVCTFGTPVRSPNGGYTCGQCPHNYVLRVSGGSANCFRS